MSVDSLLHAGVGVGPPAPNSRPLLAVFHAQSFSQDQQGLLTFSCRHSQDRNIPQTTAKSFTDEDTEPVRSPGHEGLSEWFGAAIHETRESGRPAGLQH